MPYITNAPADALKRILGANVRCPMCGGNHFSILDGYLRNDVQRNLNSFTIGGETVPSVAIICDKCGFISQHAVGVIRPETLQRQKESDDAK